MHRRNILVVAAVLVAVSLALGFFWPFRNSTETLVLPGLVEIQEVRLGSKVGGRVEKVEVTEGDLVEAGRPLVTFEVPELKAQHEQWKARLAAAEAELEKAEHGPRVEEKEAARAAVAASRARLERLKTGWREEEKRQARSELESAEADLKLAREDFERIDRLYRQSQGSVSRADYDAARANRNRALGRVAAAKAHTDMLMTGSRPEDIREAEADLAKAQANYDLLLNGTRPEDIAQLRAQAAEARGKLHEIEVNLKEATVVAPERCVVEVLAVRKGDLVPPNQPILRVLRADDIWVKVYVPETELGKVRVGQTAEVTIDSHPGERFTGTVLQVASIGEFTPRNVQSVDERRHQVFGVRIRVPQPAEPERQVLKSGMAAEVTLPLQR